MHTKKHTTCNTKKSKAGETILIYTVIESPESNIVKQLPGNKMFLLHCVQKKTPTHIFFHIFMNYLWI